MSGLGDDAEFARKFDREARAAAKLSHPNVVAVFDQGRDIVEGHSSRPYIVMEHIDGQTLRDVINREAPLTPLRALEAHRAGAGRARRRARRRTGAPRREAGECADQRPRAGQGRRFRAGQGDLFADLHGHPGPADRHRLVPAARAGRRRSGGRPLRCLQRRRRALRTADRPQTAHRGHPDPGRVRACPQGRTAAVDLPDGRTDPALSGRSGRPGHGAQRLGPTAGCPGVPHPGATGGVVAPAGAARGSGADRGPDRPTAPGRGGLRGHPTGPGPDPLPGPHPAHGDRRSPAGADAPTAGPPRRPTG